MRLFSLLGNTMHYFEPTTAKTKRRKGTSAPSAVTSSAAPLTTTVAVTKPSKSSLGVAATRRSTLVAGKSTMSKTFRESKRQQYAFLDVGVAYSLRYYGEN